METLLKAGAGKAEILFSAEYYPQDGYAGGYNAMHARSLIIECGLRVVLVSLELPSIRPFELMDSLRDEIATLANVSREQVWLCMTHSLSAPHVPKNLGGIKFQMHMCAVRQAILAATSQALQTLQAAKFGVGAGSSAITVSREIESVDGWWIGLAGKDPVDNTLTVLRFDGMDGTPVAIVYHHALKPCVLEETVMSDGKRYASADLCGEGSRIAEEVFGCPVLFFMGAGGDVFPKKKGHYLTLGDDGHFVEVHHREEAYAMLQELGTELGNDLVEIANTVESKLEAPSIQLCQMSLTVPGQKSYPRETAPKPPVLRYTFLEDLPQKIDYSLLTIGDCAIAGMKSEVSTSTMEALKAGSPFAHTLLFSMVNGGQSYIADNREFDRLEYPALHTTLGRGTAEIYIEKTLEKLKTLYKEQG